MALDPFFQQGMNNWSRAIADRRGQAAGLQKLAQAGNLKRLLQAQDARAKSALEKVKHENQMRQIGLQYNQMLPESAKWMYGQPELSGLRASQITKNLGNIGGVSALSGKAGMTPTIPGLSKMLSGMQTGIGDWRQHVPVDISTAQAGVGTDTTQQTGTQLVKKDGKPKIVTTKTTKKRKVPSSIGKSGNKQLTATQDLMRSHSGARLIPGKGGKGMFKFPGMKGTGPVVGPIDGKFYAVDIDGRYIDVTNVTKP